MNLFGLPDPVLRAVFRITGIEAYRAHNEYVERRRQMEVAWRGLPLEQRQIALKSDPQLRALERRSRRENLIFFAVQLLIVFAVFFANWRT